MSIVVTYIWIIDDNMTDLSSKMSICDNLAAYLNHWLVNMLVYYDWTGAIIYEQKLFWWKDNVKGGGSIYGPFLRKKCILDLSRPLSPCEGNHYITNILFCSIIVHFKENFIKVLRGPRKMGFCENILVVYSREI